MQNSISFLMMLIFIENFEKKAFWTKNVFWAKNFFGPHFFLFSDSRDLVIHYHKLRKLNFANHFINYQK